MTSDTTSNSGLQSALLSSLVGGQTGGLDLQSLLAAQASGGQDGGLDIASLLAAQAGNNSEPGDDQLNMALRWLEQRRAAAAQSAPVEDTPSAAEIELERLEELQQQRERLNQQREQARELKRVMNALYEEVEALRARNDTLAAALGACYLCFGEDIACPECAGKGRAGWLRPDAAAFRQYVVPAVASVRAIQQPRMPGSTLSRGQPVSTRRPAAGSQS